jgi:hypothetical protein
MFLSIFNPDWKVLQAVFTFCYLFIKFMVWDVLDVTAALAVNYNKIHGTLKLDILCSNYSFSDFCVLPLCHPCATSVTILIFFLLTLHALA